MKSFLEYSRQIDEKQIQYGKNANYGQVVFFAGGAASGKGFAVSNFIDTTKFKVWDVDDLKIKLTKMPSMVAKYPGIDKLKLNNPEDVRQLHLIAKNEGIPEKQLKAWIGNFHSPDTLPNLLFDMTFKSIENASFIIPDLIKAGYKPQNIHITWILANYNVAVQRNRMRERVVPDDIMLLTHSGAAMTMKDILSGSLPKEINGSFTVVLNNPEEVSFYTRSDDEKSKITKPSKSSVVKDFTYITVKKAGAPMQTWREMQSQIREKIFSWVMKNAPQSDEVKGAYSS
jgi:dephospho-CoA kinase